jgi:hypothetical protein
MSDYGRKAPQNRQEEWLSGRGVKAGNFLIACLNKTAKPQQQSCVLHRCGEMFVI